MTYPDLTATGFFSEKGKSATSQREKLAAIGMEWFQKCKSERMRQERQWYLNLAFFYGQHYVQFKQTPGNSNFDLYVPNAPYYRVRITINQIRRIIRKEISRLTAQKPNAYVVPASTDDLDVFAAQAGEQIWDSLWRRLHFNKVIRQAVFWQSVCGNGFIKSYWDPSKNDPGYQPIMDISVLEKAGVAGMSLGPSGDICIEKVTPFHIYVPDLLIEDIEEQPYVIHAQVRNNAQIRQMYNIEPQTNKYEEIDDKMQSVMGVDRKENKKDQTVILEIWVKPGYLPELPDGGMFTMVGSQVVQGMTSWPYDHGQYPFTKLDSIPTGKFYNASIIEDLIPIQRELNRTRSQLIEAKNRMSKPQLAAEKGSVDARKITSEPGQLIEYAVGFQPPQPIPLQAIPSYVTEEVDRLYTDLSDMSGQHEVSNGSTPPGVTAATAISFLQEQDESLIATHYTSIEEAIEKVAAQTLNYVQMYWDEPRTVKIVGIEGTYDVQTFKGSDLRGNNDIRVEAGSALPTSRAAKQAFIMDLMKMGFIPADKGLELMEVGGLNRLYEELQVDQRQAQRENMKMRVVTEEQMLMHQQQWAQQNPEATVDVDSGLALEPPPIVPVNTWDNHAVHIEIHNRYRKSQSFEQVSPVVRALFEEHVRQHQEALAGQQLHPLTGMDESNPDAPNPEDEADAMDQMAQEDNSGGESTGPTPMPELSDETGGAPQ